jgi:hypothetical protein
VATGDQLRTVAQGTAAHLKLRSVCAVLFSFRRVRKIEKSDHWLRNVSVSLSVRPPTRNNLAPTWRIFVKFDIWVFFSKTCRKNSKLHQNLTRITRTLHEDRYTFFIISRSILLRMRNVSDKSCRENQNTRFLFSNLFFLKSCHLWDNVEKYCRAGQATDDNMAHAHFTLGTKSYKHALRIHSEYVTRIAFPLQQWLHESASMLRYTHIACLIVF